MAWAEIQPPRGRRFPYREEGNPPILRPTVDVRLSHGGVEWGCRALIDTGAPITFFDRGMADALAIRLDAGMDHEIKIFGGRWYVQFFHVDLELVAAPEFNWLAEVAFVKSYDLKMPFQGVLGTAGFLDKHIVTFNKYADYFTIEDAGADDAQRDAYTPAGYPKVPVEELPDDTDWWRPTAN